MLSLILHHPALTHYRLIRLRSNAFGINRGAQFQLTLTLSQPVPLAQWMSAPLGIEWPQQACCWTLVQQVKQQGSRVELQLSDALGYLEQRQHHRVFARETLSTLLQRLLKPYSMIQLELDLATSDKQILYYPQYNQSDAVFFRQLIARYGLYYVLRAEAKGCRLSITHKQQNLNPNSSSTRMPISQVTGMISGNDNLKQLRQIVSGGQHGMTGTTESFAGQPGQMVKVADKIYQLDRMQWQVDCDEAGAMSIANQWHLITVTEQTSKVKKPFAPAVTHGILQSQGRHPNLTVHGFYHVKSGFQQTESHTNPHTLQLPMLQFFGGEKQSGWHHPNGNNTVVIVADVADRVTPVILGALNQREHPNPVTSVNHTQHLITTSSGQQWLVDDSSAQLGFYQSIDNRILWSEALDNAYLKMNCHGGPITLQAADNMMINTEGNIHYQMDRNYQLAIKGNYTVNVKQAVSMESGQHIKLSSDMDMVFKGQQDLNLTSQRHIEGIAQQHLIYQTRGNSHWQTQQDPINLSAKQDISISSSLLHCTNQQASIKQDNTTLTLLGKQIIFQAKQIQLAISNDAFNL